jgi:outer membrane protein assembly factor BamB
MKRINWLFIFISIGMVFLTTTATLAVDWPQYLGPNRNGTSDQKGLLRSWPENGPEVLWTVAVGKGFGGPVIKEGKVYLLDRDDKVGDNMRCFDLSDGQELWNFAYEAPGRVMFPGSRSVPIVEGNYVYSCGHNGDLYCIDINTHKPVWNKNVWTDFGGGRIPTWAITQCPLIYGDLLILASQAPQAGVVAYEKLTGDVKWKTPSLGGVGYVSPAIVKIGSEDHVVMITATSRGWGGGAPTEGKVAGIDPLTGKVLWEYTNWQCMIPVPCAVDAGQDMVLITGGYKAGAVMLKIDKKADGSYAVTELYKNPDFGSHTQPPVLCNGYFYAECSINETKNGLVCMSIDGQTKWKTGRNPMFDKGGLILADGLILATDGAKTLYLIEPAPSGFEPLASAEVLKEGIPGSSSNSMDARFGGATQNWAPLALADGKLLIRDQSRLMCIRVAQ